MLFFYLLLGYIYQCHVNNASGIDALPHKEVFLSIPVFWGRMFASLRVSSFRQSGEVHLVIGPLERFCRSQ